MENLVPIYLSDDFSGTMSGSINITEEIEKAQERLRKNLLMRNSANYKTIGGNTYSIIGGIPIDVSGSMTECKVDTSVIVLKESSSCRVTTTLETLILRAKRKGIL